MHKNQQTIDKIWQTISEKNLCSASFDDAITKTYFFHKIGQIFDIPLVYYDFDLLYSGYLGANILSQNKNVELLNPKENWRNTVGETIDKISKQKHIVVIDSLNGFFTLLTDNKDSGRIINTVLIMMASAATKSDSTVLIGSTAKSKNNDGWFLPGIGRKVVQIPKMNFISVRKQNGALNLISWNDDNSVKFSLPITNLDFE
ncbi:MAG TPA: hypothetical protein HA292_00645 [Candidatus Nitrosotenuis sp.]|nr:hypothetical protein [Candidatus Nitrosotenuis sp.]HIH45587.1 hypothetical protein [Candidatus Nitrosotenuis sp.]HIH68272.1 hypothetical protein [Candidatus Nitrosotenuis sp.]HII03910.1 hypothetical protein [Candidatus Nitrosotenuis sp.]